MNHNKDTIFLNADYIVIEYIDIIKSPYLILLNALRQNTKIREILNIYKIDGLNDKALYEWYIHREHQNFLKDLNKYPDILTDDKLDILLEEQLKAHDIFYTRAVPLLLTRSLAGIIDSKMSKDIIIYHPHDNEFAKQDLERVIKRKVTFMNDFDKVLDVAGYNSTYFLSDIEKIIRMKEKEVLQFSSISLPYEYRYNKKNMTEFKYDLMGLIKEIPFKLSYFNTCTTL